MQRLRFALVLLLAASVLATAAASSSAITVSPGGANTATGSLTFFSRAIAMRCAASLSETITAGTYAPGDQFGTLDSASLTRCTVPMTITLLSAPIFAADLVGTLMHKLIPIGLLATIAGSSCLWRGRLGADTDGTTLRIDGALPLVLDLTQPLTRPFCTSLGNLTASGTLTLSPGYTVSLP